MGVAWIQKQHRAFTFFPGKLCFRGAEWVTCSVRTSKFPHTFSLVLGACSSCTQELEYPVSDMQNSFTWTFTDVWAFGVSRHHTSHSFSWPPFREASGHERTWMIYGPNQSNFHSTKKTQNVLFGVQFWNKQAYKEKSEISFYVNFAKGLRNDAWTNGTGSAL